MKATIPVQYYSSLVVVIDIDALDASELDGLTGVP